MPSIPQSLLWISLVVLWLFVLVPMLISKRDAVRRTSDVALATRVLNTGRARAAAAARAVPRPDTAAIRIGNRPRIISTMTSTRNPTTSRRNARVVRAAGGRGRDRQRAGLPRRRRRRRGLGRVTCGRSRRMRWSRSRKRSRSRRLKPTSCHWISPRQPKRTSRRARTSQSPTAPRTSTSTSPIPRAWRRRQTPTCSWPSR